MNAVFETKKVLEFVLGDAMGYDIITHLIGHELNGPGVALISRDACRGECIRQDEHFWKAIMDRAVHEEFGGFSKEKKRSWFENIAKTKPTLTITGATVECPL